MIFPEQIELKILEQLIWFSVFQVFSLHVKINISKRNPFQTNITLFVNSIIINGMDVEFLDVFTQFTFSKKSLTTVFTKGLSFTIVILHVTFHETKYQLH